MSEKIYYGNIITNIIVEQGSTVSLSNKATGWATEKLWSDYHYAE